MCKEANLNENDIIELKKGNKLSNVLEDTQPKDGKLTWHVKITTRGGVVTEIQKVVKLLSYFMNNPVARHFSESFDTKEIKHRL